MPDWLPEKESEFGESCDKWLPLLENPRKQAEYHWDKSDCRALAEEMKVYRSYDPNEPASSAGAAPVRRNKARGSLRKAMRRFAGAHIRNNSYMDDETKTYFGIVLRDAKAAVRPDPGPKIRPELTAENTKNPLEHKLTAKNRDKSAASVIHFVRYAWQIGGKKPASGAELPKGMFSKRTTVVIIHSEAERDNAVYYAACYENEAGVTGPWSPVVEAHIG